MKLYFDSNGVGSGFRYDTDDPNEQLPVQFVTVLQVDQSNTSIITDCIAFQFGQYTYAAGVLKKNGIIVSLNPIGPQAINDANRTIDLSGDLTVTAAATISGTNTGDVTYTADEKTLHLASTVFSEINSTIMIQDQKAQNTAGGTFTAGAWQTRDLNTKVTDAASLCTLASNQMTLVAGTYFIMASAPAAICNRHQAKLYNVTDSIDVLIGTSALADATSVANVTVSLILGSFTIAASKALEIRHQCQNTGTTNGFGFAANFTTEIYTTVFLKRVG